MFCLRRHSAVESETFWDKEEEKVISKKYVEWITIDRMAKILQNTKWNVDLSKCMVFIKMLIFLFMSAENLSKFICLREGPFPEVFPSSSEPVNNSDLYAYEANRWPMHLSVITQMDNACEMVFHIPLRVLLSLTCQRWCLLKIKMHIMYAKSDIYKLIYSLHNWELAIFHPFPTSPPAQDG